MDTTCITTAILPAATHAHAQSPPPPPEAAAGDQNSRAVVCLGRLIRALALAVVTYSFAVRAWQARQEPWDLAFIFGAYATLAALLLCLRRAEQLTPASPTGERRRLHAAVWALSTAMSCAFAYRVSPLVPAALVVVVWCMTSFVVLLGFYTLMLCKNQQYQSVDAVGWGDCDSSSNDLKPLVVKNIRPSDETV